MANTEYGDITPRTAAFAASELLERAVPHLVIEKFGQAKPLPTKSSKTIKFRRYNSLANATTALTEGVTPTAKQLSSTDVTATVSQYGDLVTITDVIVDTHEDPVLKETVGIMGEQAANTIETLRFNVLKAGTNVAYSNGSARNAVNTAVSLNDIRKATRSLKNQNARPLTSVVKSTPSYGTQAIAPAFIGICHPDLEADLRGLTGFVSAENYGTMTPFESEIGKIESVRFVTSTVMTPWADAGGLDGNVVVSTTGTNADVYPIIIVARDAYGLVPLKGKTSITPAVVNPKPSDSDPLAQRGHVSWKCYDTTAILNDSWMYRLEVAVTVL